MELTEEGRRFCAAAGFVEEIVVLAAFGIRIAASPILVLAFMWVLFVILTAAALIGAGWLAERFAVSGAMPLHRRAHRSAPAVRMRVAAARPAACRGQGIAA